MKSNVMTPFSNNPMGVSSNDNKLVSNFRTHSAREKNKFQSLFLSSMEKSQAESNANNRLKDSSAKKDSAVKDTVDPQSKISELQKHHAGASRFERIESMRCTKNQDQVFVGVAPSRQEPLMDSQSVSEAFSINPDIQNINTAELLKQNSKYVYSIDHDDLDSDADQSEHPDGEATEENLVTKDAKSEIVLTALPPQTQSEKSYQDLRDQRPVANTLALVGETKLNENTSFVGQIKFNEHNLLANQEQPIGSQSVVQNRFGTDAWGTEFSQKVVWMVGGGKQSAILTLNPPNLGPIKVEVTMHNNIAHTVFESSNAEVRLALESGLSKLREMLALRGVELGQTTVKAEKAQVDYVAQKSRVLNRLLNTFV